MQTLVLLPQLELTMENVRVASLQVKVGDRVAAEQSLLEVETEKAISPVPAPKAGFVRKIFVTVEDQLREKAPVCVLTDLADEPFEDSIAPSGPWAKNSKLVEAAPAESVPGELSGVKAAPAARKLAKELGVPLASVTGSGPGGRITVEDVQGHATGASVNGEAGWQPLSSVRLALIGQMQKSLAEIPQFHLARQLEVAPLLIKKENITFTVRLVRSVALALEKHTSLRMTISGNQVRVEPVSVAVAMESSRGLVAPVLRSGNLATFESITIALKEFQARAKTGDLRRTEMMDGPFAISNLGMLQVDFFSPFVFHGQTAVLAIGRAVEGRAWFNLAVDHRIVDGAEAARFLETLQQEISRA